MFECPKCNKAVEYFKQTDIYNPKVCGYIYAHAINSYGVEYYTDYMKLYDIVKLKVDKNCTLKWYQKLYEMFGFTKYPNEVTNIKVKKQYSYHCPTCYYFISSNIHRLISFIKE